MTSLFDTNVRIRRQHTPWARISLIAFMREMVWNNPGDEPLPDHGVNLNVHLRPDVSTRLWWTLEWTGGDGSRHSVDSQDFDLLLWRAAEIESQIQEKLEQIRKTKSEKEQIHA